MSGRMVELKDGATVHVVEDGEGMPVFFQHGLGGDRNQAAESFPAGLCRRITVECRGHGRSPFDADGHYSIARFADDLLAVADALQIDRFAIGGISMGAAIAARLAVTVPERVTALMLVRPAWIAQSRPDNMRPFEEAAALLRDHGAGGKDIFRRSETGERLAREAPDNLASLMGFFNRAEPERLAVLLDAIARDGPGISAAQLARVTLPTLVVGHGEDLVHPLGHAQRLAELIPAAEFAEITPKARDRALHFEDLHAALSGFLARHVIRQGETS